MNRPSEIRDATTLSRFDEEVDVIVVGLGAAGASAALEAARAGAEVLVLERASGGGGTSAMSGGVLYLGGGTPIQKACGFDDAPEEMFKYLMASCGPAPEEEKIRAYCEQSVNHFHWVVEQGVPFKPVYYPGYSGEPPTDDGLVFSGMENTYPFNEIARPAPRGHVGQVPGAAGGLLMQKLVGAVQASRAQVRTDAHCLTLVQARDRTVQGVVVSQDGEERTVRARRGVVLTTGGFINNDDMLRMHAPELRRCQFRVGAEGDDGSGIRMGIGAGAATRNLGMGSISLPLIPPVEIEKGILINQQGQRFINEDTYMGRMGEYALLRQNGRVWLLLDDATFVRPDVPREVVAVGETPAEIETSLGLPEGSLEATLSLYNRHAANGEDPVFHKASSLVTPLASPPYGALDCTPENSLYAAFTLGGLDTSLDTEVLTPDGVAIPGLYAAGRASACLACPGYSSGLSLGDATFFGRAAGRSAARAAS